MHPSGFPVAEDGPAHVAPPIDVRPKARARNAPPVKPPPQDESVAFDLAFPVEERVSTREPIDLDSEKTIEEEPAPLTVDYERSIPTKLHRKSPLQTGGGDDDDEITPHPPPEPVTLIGARPIKADPDEEDQMSQRDALILDIAAIGPLDERPDRDVEREVAARATLARARALRFRLSLLDAWPAGQTPRAAAIAVTNRPLHLDLALDCALLGCIADGAPTPPRSTPGASLYPFLSPLASVLLAYRPDLPRSALRDRGAATIARLTIVGWKGALDKVTKAANGVPTDVRRLVLEIASRVAFTTPMSSIRLGALNDLERALILPTGSAALAIDQARRG